MELNNFKIDFCAVSETKKKGKGTFHTGDYIMVYSGKQKTERASAGVGLIIHNKYMNNIDNIEYISERILLVTLKFPKAKWTILSLYAPDIAKPKEIREEFYEELQNIVSQIPKENLLIMLGDLNARVGNTPVPGIKQRFNESVANENGDLLTNFCSMNSLRINNTFFDHKWRHKITWGNSRGQVSMIDYVITNRNVHPTQILDVRSYRTADIGSDHSLVIAKLRASAQLTKKPRPELISKFNLEAFQNESIKHLYKNRLSEKLQEMTSTPSESPDRQWENIQECITRAAEEALGKRTVNVNGPKKSTPWFTPEIKELANEKRKAFQKYNNNPSAEERITYKRIRNRVNSEIRKIKEGYWESFTADMEHDLYGSQKKVWKMIKRSRSEMNEFVTNSKLAIHEWERFFQQLYGGHTTSHSDYDHDEISDDMQLYAEEITKEIKCLKNRKAPGPDNISNEMIKYGGPDLTSRLTDLFQTILKKCRIPEKWKESIIIPIYKKGCKADPENYRGISLLNTTLKLFTRVILSKLLTYVQPKEEQQGFRKNRSTTDAIFIMRQIVEKSIEFNNPAFLCFVDLKKAFDRVRLDDVEDCLREREVPEHLVRMIRELNSGTTARIKSTHQLSKPITLTNGIRQGDSLSPMLFNLVMDKIIANLPQELGYKMGRFLIHIMCYADDAVLIADSEENLQILMTKFDEMAEKLNMEISLNKSKCLVVSKRNIKCEIRIKNTLLDQVSTFNYLGVEISAKRDLKQEVKNQATKAARISGCLYNLVWNNKYMSAEAKTRIYKTTVRPVLTYAAETKGLKQLLPNKF